MAQKKSETVPAAQEKNMPSADEKIDSGSFVITFWNQFEESRERARMVRENQEDAYINALREVFKFNKQYRKSIANLYDQTQKANKDMVSELMHQLNSGKEEIKEDAVPTPDREELKKELKEVSGQLEKLVLTPIKSIFHMIDQFEDNFEKNAETNVAYARERRNAWFQVRKNYVLLARKTHLNLVERGKSSIKELVKTQ